MTIDEIRERLKPFNLKQVAAITGLSHTAVWRFASGKTQRPTWQLVDRLERFVETGQ